jgi:membrane AbrB-like protein
MLPRVARMPALLAFLQAARRPIETLAIASAGGLLFHLAGFPAAFVSGSMFAVAVAALFGRPALMPGWLARIFFLAIGISLGTVVTPATLRSMAAAPLSIGVLAVATVAITFGSFCYLRLVHRFAPLSALLAASPGSLAQVLALSLHYKADVRGIVVVQSMRVLIIGVGLPGTLGLLGFESTPIVRAANLATPAWLTELAILVVVSTATAFGLQRLRFPGGLLFGALLGSAVLHGSGWIEVALPTPIAYAAMIGTGAVAGARFAGMTLPTLLHYLGAALGSFAVMAAIAALALAPILPLVSVPVPEMVVSYAPGAQETMLMMALALHLDPVFIGAHHLARFLIVSLGIPAAAAMLAGRAPPPKS